MNDSKRLVTTIITAALKNGTSLRTDTNDHYIWPNITSDFTFQRSISCNSLVCLKK